jgi:hypothetical protein
VKRTLAAVLLAVFLIVAGTRAAGAADGKTVAERCAKATAAVTIATSSTAEAGTPAAGWTLQAQGTWSAGGGAAGALLEVRIDMDRYQSETHTGAGGEWSLSQDFPFCGKHTLRVYSMPMLREGELLINCLERGASVPLPVELPCEPVAQIDSCTWQCNEDDCTGSCTASARSGVPDYVAHWGLNDRGYQAVEGYSRGPWSHDVICKPGEKVTFKVRGRNGTGRWSGVAERACGQP